MFNSSAELYDLIYARLKDYPAEAAHLAALIRASHPTARRILDVACGTAEHARLLSTVHGFEVDGLDLEPGLVRVARDKLPGANVFEADMTSFDIPGRYDVILCLFSAIGYVRTLDKVTATLRRIRAHLAAEGMVMLEPWFPPGVLESGRVCVKTAETPDVSVCRMSLTEVDGLMSRLRFEYLVGRPTGIERSSEVHELGLFTAEEMQECFRQAELVATYDPAGLAGRGLYVAHAA